MTVCCCSMEGASACCCCPNRHQPYYYVPIYTPPHDLRQWELPTDFETQVRRLLKKIEDEKKNAE